MDSRQYRPAQPHTCAPYSGSDRHLGINIGAETIKVVELRRLHGELRWTRRLSVEHQKDPAGCLQNVLADWDWTTVSSAAVSGRLARQVQLPQIPIKQAQAFGYRFLFGTRPATLVSIGSHGFSVLELRPDGLEVFRENSRCSQGTGNFLRQLVGRFGLTIEEASALATPVENPAVLSGRCPVILKTDMTHLANKGEDKARILAGLFDAVCENVLTLIKPGLCPPNVVLIGGVGRAPRVHATFRQRLQALEMTLAETKADDGLYFEALGCALLASENLTAPPPLADLLAAPPETSLERVPALAHWLPKVHRMPKPALAVVNGTPVPVVLGFDIGSTGSKAVALAGGKGAVVWEGYRGTNGDPVGAAQGLLEQFERETAGRCPVHSIGVTGSGREIVGSLFAACYGKDRVYVLNEIAAHAEGALHYDARVDTIFEIGGQDAKYIRLADGRVIDCAMNEACSAGTGSFIEEQGRKFGGIRDVVHLGQEALAADDGVSLGQHCSVFMAEVIDEAIAAGVETPSIIAGLYDSIIQNYLNRVKGSRSVGRVIFCQGMPFSSDALAAAVARQTGSEVIVPPNPGTVGALGIALLATREFRTSGASALDAKRFLNARVESKDSFQCGATVGCGGAGNHCRIERLSTVVDGKRLNFTWGGGCSLHDKGTRKRKLPNLAPDPFRDRDDLVRSAISGLHVSRPRPRVAISGEFALSGLLPFFATYLHEIGLNVTWVEGADQKDLKRGVQGAHVPFCAPMQLQHGLAARMSTLEVSFVFLPMLRSHAAAAGTDYAVTCPIVQASADLLRNDLGVTSAPTLLSPVIDFGKEGYDSEEFKASCRQIAELAGVPLELCPAAHARATAAQLAFERSCLEIGARALEYCRLNRIVPVVVLGRPYTLYNTVLNSNVPAILREQGAIGIPIDCYPLEDDTPVFRDMYWSHGQRILRAAHQIRRSENQYSLYCSNYACGPDSFNLHFYAHAMAGKPFAIIETDGHSGDAGTKTRVEAFLHCVEQDSRSCTAVRQLNDFQQVQAQTLTLRQILENRERVLIPWMGPGSEVLAALFRGLDVPAESLPQPGRNALMKGRRHTSGKECLPAVLTIGGLLERLEEAGDGERFAYVMTSTHGPCRFGVYNLLNQIVLERQGWKDRVHIWSPGTEGYFAEFPAGVSMLVYAGFMASDLLLECYDDAVPSEAAPGAARRVYDRYFQSLLDLVERCGPGTRSTVGSLWQVLGGELFGIRKLLEGAARDFRSVQEVGIRPTVLVVGEIYVRCVPFANDFVMEKLRQRGIHARLAPLHEWLEYCAHLEHRRMRWNEFGRRFSAFVQETIGQAACLATADTLGSPARPRPAELLEEARPYLSDQLEGEAVLTLGNPLLAWKRGLIDGVISVGPHECMPNKIAESQFFHVSENTGLPSLTLSLNGDPIDPETLDSFAFEVHSRFRKKHGLEPRESERRRPAPAQPFVATDDGRASDEQGVLTGSR